MKGVTWFILALTVCMSMACSALAAEFTPSVERKGAPEVVALKDEEGDAALGVIKGLASGKEFVYGNGLIITALKDAERADTIPNASVQALLDVFDGLKDGSIGIPYEKLDSENAEKLVVRDLFDVSWTEADGDTYADLIEKEGVCLELTFQIDVAADAKVYVMVYKNNAWDIVDAANNGDGTITCVFEHLCPVAILVERSDTTDENTTKGSGNLRHSQEDARDLPLWTGVLVVSCAAAAVAVYGRKRKK